VDIEQATWRYAHDAYRQESSNQGIGLGCKQGKHHSKSTRLVYAKALPLCVHEYISSGAAVDIEQATWRYTHDAYRQESSNQGISIGYKQGEHHSKSIRLVYAKALPLCVHEYISSGAAVDIEQATWRYTHDAYRQESSNQGIGLGCKQGEHHSKSIRLAYAKALPLWFHEYISSGAAVDIEQATWRYGILMMHIDKNQAIRASAWAVSREASLQEHPPCLC
jgi:hypothetical protein